MRYSGHVCLENSQACLIDGYNNGRSCAVGCRNHPKEQMRKVFYDKNQKLALLTTSLLGPRPLPPDSGSTLAAAPVQETMDACWPGSYAALRGAGSSSSSSSQDVPYPRTSGGAAGATTGASSSSAAGSTGHGVSSPSFLHRRHAPKDHGQD